jgi:hypothetical protein
MSPLTLLRPCLRAALLAAVLAATPQAQAGSVTAPPPLIDRDGFEDAVMATIQGAGASFPFVRCAGLYRFLRVRAGQADPAAQGPPAATEMERMLVEAAKDARLLSRGRTIQVATIEVEADIAAVAALYRERLALMPEGTGVAWWDDAVIETDIRACGLLLRRL